jgi:hypothetical protein
MEYCTKCGSKLIKTKVSEEISYSSRSGEKETKPTYELTCPNSSVFSWGHSYFIGSIYGDVMVSRGY